MAWLPKSRKARRRLLVVLSSGVVLAFAAILTFVALGDQVSFFYTPSQAIEKEVPVGRTIQLGGLVEEGSVVRHPDGSVEFVVTDDIQAMRVSYAGDLPDLFREGQGVVAKGALEASGDFAASEILAKHDESYRPRELEKVMKEAREAAGEDSAMSSYDPSAYETGGEAQ